jgi:hypothetical protein
VAAEHVGAAALRFVGRRAVERIEEPERSIECAGAKVCLGGVQRSLCSTRWILG